MHGSVLHAQVPRAPRERLREERSRNAEWECGEGPKRLPSAFNPTHHLLSAYLVPDTVLGSGDPGMAQMQGREKGGGSY